jgi:hypothetical protein
MNMKIRLTASVALLLATLTFPAAAQQLTPVWEYLINKPGVPIGVLTNAVNYDTDNDNGDGHSLMDSLGALTRYDSNRLLLAIRENGINESAAGANLALAAQYPDRSLIWINPTNGTPLGIALNMGLYPVPLDADFLAAELAVVPPLDTFVTNQYWWTYTVGPDGAIYTGYKNKILRYASDGQGGINPKPAVVFTLAQSDLSNHSIDTSLWPNWRWARLRVVGTGTNMVILAGTTSILRGNWRLTTTDGTNFVAGSLLALGGGTSTPIPSRDPATPSDEWDYAGIYPGNSSGADSSYSRYTVSPPFTDNYTRDATFTAPADPFTYLEKYLALFIGDVDANKDLDYLAVYSTPSWNSRTVFGPNAVPRPGWLALNTHEGRFLSAHKIDITEDAELLTTDQASLFQGTIGFVSLNKLTDGTVEVLWSGTIYGYGRYLVSPYGPQPQAPDGGTLPGPFPGNSVSAANWIATGSSTFDTTVSIGLEGGGPIPWSMSRYNRGDFSIRLSPLDPVGAQDNFGILQDFAGPGTAAVPEEQAWRPSSDAGVLIPTARTNGPIDWNDGQGPFFPVVAASTGTSSGYGYSMVDGTFGKGDADVQTGKAGDQNGKPSPEANFNFATTWFPYNQGWTAGAVGNPDAAGNPQWDNANAHSPGLETNIVSWLGSDGAFGGTAVLSLPGVNSLQDGMLFTTSSQGDSAVNIIASAPKSDGSGWVISIREAAESNPLVLATNQSQFQFVYIPYRANKLIGGYINSSGAAVRSNGVFTLTRAAAGTYNLTIPGKNGTNGVLLLENAGFLAGTTNLADNNFLSYQFNDDGTGNGVFVIQARHTDSSGSFPLSDASFYFAWVDFADPLIPPATSAPAVTAPSLSIARTGATALITWPTTANGFTLETTGSLSPAPISWTAVGVVGQGTLTSGFTLPATPATQFYRLRK